MSIALLRIGDGRDDYHDRSFASAVENLPKVDAVVTVDDRDHKLGFAGAIQQGWEDILDLGADYVFHLELDFTFCEPVDLHAMIDLLERQPHLAQVSLKRQPWNERERAAGGIVEADLDDFTEQRDDQAVWTEHRRYWTTNPSVYSTRWCQLGWPQEPQSEGVFTHMLLTDPLLRFAIWGGRHDPARVTHIGDLREGGGY